MNPAIVTPNSASGSHSFDAAGDVFPDFAISLEEAERRTGMLREFVRDHMVEGEDYGLIPGAGPKPVLLKPGAEKLNAIFGLAPLVEVTNRNEDWERGFVAYEIKVTLLNKRTNKIEAEGIGSCNSRERRYKNQDSANVANTLLKMARKRALIDATLSATRASGLFTQDLEDLEHEAAGTGSKPPARPGSRDERSPRQHRASREERPAHERPAREHRTAREHPAAGDERTAREATGDRQAQPPREERPVPRHQQDETGAAGAAAGAGANVLTEAQRGAILAIANKVFGKSTKEEMSRLVDKPINQLSKSEASALIDRLRSMLPEQPQPRSDYAADREATGR